MTYVQIVHNGVHCAINASLFDVLCPTFLTDLQLISLSTSWMNKMFIDLFNRWESKLHFMRETPYSLSIEFIHKIKSLEMMNKHSSVITSVVRHSCLFLNFIAVSYTLA